MTEIQITLIVAYVLMAALLGLTLTYGRIHWGLKFTLLALVISGYALSYNGWKQIQGWPSKTALPDHFLLHASVIEEPNDQQGTKGRIFIWASNLADNQIASEPRAYEMQYQQKLHASLEEAMRNMRDGNIQLGGRAKQGDKVVKSARTGEQPSEFEFNPLPDPALPEK